MAAKTSLLGTTPDGRTYEELCEEQAYNQSWGLRGPFNHGWEDPPKRFIEGDPLKGEIGHPYDPNY